MKVSVTVRIRGAPEGTASVGVIGSSSSSSSSSSNHCSPSSGEKSISFPGHNSNTFTFDNIIDGSASQSDVFDTAAEPLVVDALNGINCTLFTYGQTGSGKTYTMQGGSSEDKGIIPRTADMILSELERRKGDNAITSYEFKLSVLEIYKERLFDLLSAPGSSKDSNSLLRIREHMGSVWVEGLVEQQCSTPKEFTDLTARASKRRKVGSHSMNSASSRSHQVVIMNVRQIQPGSAQGVAGKKVNSKLYLIDLAGSEMVKKTDASGARLAEAKSINSSLSALGKVIFALTSQSSNTGSSSCSNSRGGAHIPFRDSKLTRLLQDSLGGNTRTSLVLTISSEQKHLSETVATLRFGERARFLRTCPLVNAELIVDESFLRIALMAANKQIATLNFTVSELQGQLTALISNSVNQGVSLLCAVCYSVKKTGEIDDVESKDKAEVAVEIVDPRKGHGDGKLLKLPAIVAPPINSSQLPPKSPRIEQSPIVAEPQQDTQAPSTDTDDASNNDDESQLCTVCGLDDEATSALRAETGEWLGDMFACDGNCGGKFHTRCVGLLIGSDSAIDGEWMCSACTAGCSENDRGDGVTILASDIIATALRSPAKLSSPQATDSPYSNHLDSVAETLSGNTDSYLKAEYHAMRLERNRVLSQWQQEKRVTAVMEKKKMAVEKQRDLDMIMVSEENAKLKIEIENSKNELARLQSLHDNFLTEKGNSSGADDSAYYENTKGKSRCASDRLHSLLNDSAFSSFDGNDLNNNLDGEDNLKVPASQRITESELEASINSRIARRNSEKGSTSGKMWKTVERKATGNSSRSQIAIDDGSRILETAAQFHGSKPSHSSNGEGEGGPYSRDEYDRYYAYDTQDVADSATAKASEVIVPVGKSIDAESVFDSTDSLGSSGSNKYLDPLKNRLNDLLRSAMEEKESFAEIRQKYNSKKVRVRVRAREEAADTGP